MTDEHPIISPKKLIEVALPLDAINAASAREKSIRHGHPSTLHLWWARRPLAAARAVIFSQLVNDPEDLWRVQNPTKAPNKQVRGHWTKARARLFRIIEDLVLWENTTNEEVVDKAREEIRKSWREVCELNKNHPLAADIFDPNKLPGLHDPFAGGGTIPLEAQRLGLEAYASDLNPVAVLINKAMIEIPPKFSGLPPINPASRSDRKLIDREWRGVEGLAEDVRYYGKWMREEAEKRIGHLYPKAVITDRLAADRSDLRPYVGQSLTVIAWIWVRTVKSPNPAYSHVDVPLASTFVLSSKKARPTFIEPHISGSEYTFCVRTGTITDGAKNGTSAGKRKAFRCLMSDVPIDYAYIRSEGKAGRIGTKLMAIVVEGKRERLFLAPNEYHESIANEAHADWRPDSPLPKKHRNFQPPVYGMDNVGDLFTHRQLTALTCFADLCQEVRDKVAVDIGSEDAWQQESIGACRCLDPVEYGASLSLYLTFALSKCVDRNSVLTRWMHQRDSMHCTFSRQALPMNWDFVETNTLGNHTGSYLESLKWTVEAMEVLGYGLPGSATQQDAANTDAYEQRFIATDPPYYDNINYADLSDFFYVWLRRSLRGTYPLLLSTMTVPKADELVASANRHGTQENAEDFFLEGMSRVMKSFHDHAHPAAPVTIFYAFKQSETALDTTTNTGWTTFLDAINRSGLSLTGTWPMRTERANRSIAMGTNSLASSIVLVCRPRPDTAPSVSRREFIRELNATLPLAMDAMTRETEDLPSPVAPVDLSQAIIGPGMAIYSKYSAVLEADGSPMSVRTALQLINRFLSEDDFDADTQFCLHWFETHGWESGVFGEADVLARAKATSVGGLDDAGVIRSGGGKVQLLRWSEYPADWDPNKDLRLPIWETLHQMIRAFRQGGESAAGELLSQPSVQSRAEAARQLAYRLYTLCERKNWAEDARAYNELITSWSAIETAAPQVKQGELF